MKSRSFIRRFGRLWLASVLLLLMAGDYDLVLASKAAQEPESEAHPAPALHEGTPALTFAPVIKKVAPCVVTIYSTKTVKENTHNPLLNDPLFRKFFGMEEDEEPGNHHPHPRKEQSLGSGVIVSAD